MWFLALKLQAITETCHTLVWLKYHQWYLCDMIKGRTWKSFWFEAITSLFFLMKIKADSNTFIRVPNADDVKKRTKTMKQSQTHLKSLKRKPIGLFMTYVCGTRSKSVLFQRKRNFKFVFVQHSSLNVSLYSEPLF